MKDRDIFDLERERETEREREREREREKERERGKGVISWNIHLDNYSPDYGTKNRFHHL